NLSATSGLITLTDASGNKLAGSGTHALSVSGTLAQLNADLAHLSYTAGNSAGTDQVTVDVWDQAGMEGTRSIAMSVLTAPPAIILPASKTVTAGTASAVTGVSVSDLNAGTSGAMVLNL